jgi:hypothetical protein
MNSSTKFCISLQNKSEGAGVNSRAAQLMSAPITTKTGKRSARRRRLPYAWLGAGAGAGASTLGAGVALAGAGTAHADDAGPADSASSEEASSAAVKSRGANVRTVLRRSQTHNRPSDVTYTALTVAELQKIGAAAVVSSGGHSL